MNRAARRVPTGIDGFDDMADGGLPRGGVTLVLGGAGAGKTTFGVQVLAAGAQGEPAEPGILVAFEESVATIVDNTAGFRWGGASRLTPGIAVVDARLADSVEQGGDFDLIGLLAIVGDRAKRTGARRILFDGLDGLVGYLGSPALIRREMFRLREWVHRSGMCAIVTANASHGHGTRDNAEFLQFMADCVVTLDHRVLQGTALRFLRVAKYRGAPHSANELPFTIGAAGIEVAAIGAREFAHPASTERVSSGVPRLDAMLAGGYYRGSSVLITGAPGTAKTSLSAAFAAAAAGRGERTLYVSFDESPDQIVRNVASIGIHLRPLVASGALLVHSLRGRADNPEGQAARIRGLIREHRPLHLVVDPLSGVQKRGCEADAEGAAMQVLDFAKAMQVTVVSTSLLGNALPLSEQTPLNVSTIADTWMHVSYASHGGERNRALTIVKSRGSAHSNQVRELVLSEQGVTLSDVYAVGGEVLMGTLRWEKENEERRARAAAESAAHLRQQRAALALAETTAQIETLARARAIQQEELEQLERAEAATAAQHTNEIGELLQRRRADSGEPGAPDERRTAS